jgi:hypothetical protein
MLLCLSTLKKGEGVSVNVQKVYCVSVCVCVRVCVYLCAPKNLAFHPW